MTSIFFDQCIIKQKNQGLGKGYQLRLITLTSTLIFLDITKTESIIVLIVAEQSMVFRPFILKKILGVTILS